ncbi:hypothetical protein BT63DRAFT_420835 [Microthyrium microscopicum]|uniref:ribonuclease Z n=1 Tax=Microthyrium microscopicum TaxID=703497 RepID=A0A6A6ULF2_9PEZI|nr:hypothetical protein BT63DRAFT_420835 [Microthyrium microscopicum]
MYANLRFITLPSVDTRGALLEVAFPNHTYLFGRVCEGTQRAAVQESLNLVKARQLFLSGPTEWTSVGGLLGLLLTHSDTLIRRLAGMSKELVAKQHGLTVHGAPGLYHFIAMSRRYVLRFGGHVQFEEVSQNPTVANVSKPDYEDEQIKVWNVSLLPESEIENTAGTTEDEMGTLTYLKSLANTLWNSSYNRDTFVQTELQHVLTLQQAWDSESSDPNLEDAARTIWTIDPETKDFLAYSGPLPGGPDNLPDPKLKVLLKRQGQLSSIDTLPSLPRKRQSQCYIFRSQNSRGKFNAAKAMKLGVPPGPLFAKLTRGESVETADKKTVSPDMVIEPDRVGGGLAIIDLPSPEYIKDFLQRPEWKDAALMKGIDTMVWILGPDMAIGSRPASSDLLAFMNENQQRKHLITAPGITPNFHSVLSSVRMASQLSQISPTNFIKPIGSMYNAEPRAKDTESIQNPTGMVTLIKDYGMETKPHVTHYKRSIAPPVDLDISEAVSMLAQQARESNEEMKDVLEKWKSTLALRDVEVIFLGTGSSIPAPTRNVTGILLRVPGHGSYILDCGENSLGQLERIYPPQELEAILLDLRMIYVSHLHADHHLGTIGILKAWYGLVHHSIPLPTAGTAKDVVRFASKSATERVRPHLPIVANFETLAALSEFAELEDIGWSRVLPINVNWASTDTASQIPSAENQTETDMNTGDEPIQSQYCLVTTIMDLQGDEKSSASFTLLRLSLAKILGGAYIDLCSVYHCRGASAMAMRFVSPDHRDFKIAWSGDCRPSANFAMLGRNADLLIHEATFADDKHGQAVAKQHSTIGEAVLVAEAMRAKSLILTHFSQRYPKFPDLHTLVAQKGDGRAEEAMRQLREMAELEVPPFHPSRQKSRVMEELLPDSEGETNEPVDLRICAAFDFMRITIGEIANMEAYTPAFIELFREKEKEEPEDVEMPGLEDGEATEAGSKSSKKKEKKRKGKSEHQEGNNGQPAENDGEAKLSKRHQKKLKKRESVASLRTDMKESSADMVVEMPAEIQEPLADDKEAATEPKESLGN